MKKITGRWGQTPPQKTQRILAIETSSPRLSLAVGDDTRVIKEYQGPLEWRHAESLLEGMQKILKQARWPVDSLTGVLVSTGPGSFTGIRIGLAAARALGQGLKIPVVGMSSLETIAAGVVRPDFQICPMIDALRGDVFAGLYRRDRNGKLKTIWKDQRYELKDLQRKLAAFCRHPLLFTGDGAVIYKESLRTLGGEQWRFTSPAGGYPRAGALIQEGRTRLLRAGPSSYQNVMPLYLRSAAAIERKRMKNR